ncbi:protein gop (plasmid) [Escherichia coli]|uniref:protein gop n=1 Tax=Escherichia coli TaxID=562 RepID=UPI00202FFE0F|nr:protein gop [Escherichia coli]MCM1621478.1 protein gop [Escherichia coli]
MLLASSATKDISQWLLVCSGWLAALLIGWFTHRTIKAISNNHTNVIKSNMEVIKSHNESNQNLMAENKELIKELARTSEQKEKMESIAAYLATQNPQINAAMQDSKSTRNIDSEAN